MTGRPRQLLLDDAIANGSAMRVAAFFNGFQRAAGAAGGAPSASGRVARSSGKPVYSRDQISKLYRQHQQGAYQGREAEWARLEHDIIAAGREGRISKPVDVLGK